MALQVAATAIWAMQGVQSAAQSAAHAVSDTLSVAGSSLLKAALREGQWGQPQMRGDRIPVPRYEHACALIGHSMYVVGGNCGEHLWPPGFCSQQICICCCSRVTIEAL